MPMIVSLKNIVKRYTRGKQSVEVLHALNLEIPQGEISRSDGTLRIRQDDAFESDRRP